MRPEQTTGILRYKTRERYGITPRKEAIAKGLERFFTGYPCSRGHVSERETKAGKCLSCLAEDPLHRIRYREALRRVPFPKHDAGQYELLKLMRLQDGKCAICGIPVSAKSQGRGFQRTAHIDHCHKTGRIRGILCVKCNTTLGRFNDSVEFLQKAIDYLQKDLAKAEEMP